jgi:hypothetical protein
MNLSKKTSKNACSVTNSTPLQAVNQTIKQSKIKKPDPSQKSNLLSLPKTNTTKKHTHTHKYHKKSILGVILLFLFVTVPTSFLKKVKGNIRSTKAIVKAITKKR